MIKHHYSGRRTPAELGSRLQLIHGAQWLSAINDDPYARVLRGFEDDPYPLYERLGRAGAMVFSRTGAWVTASRAVASEILAHPDFGPMTAGSPPTTCNVESLDEGIVYAAAPPAVRLDGAVARAVEGLVGEVDLVTGFAGRICTEALAETFDVAPLWLAERIASTSVAVDASLCPQKLAATRRMFDALDDLRDRLGDPAAVLLTVIGAQLASTLLGNALDLLLEPHRWARLAADPSSAAQVVDEVLSRRPPVHLHAVIAQTDLDIAGTRMKAGDQVVIAVGAINRDRADEFLSLGAPYDTVFPFVREVTETALPVLAHRFPGLHRAGPALRRRRAPVTRALLSLRAGTDDRNET